MSKYIVKTKVTYPNGDNAVTKMDDSFVLEPSICADDKAAEKWAKIIFAGLKRYYTKKPYTISVTVERAETVTIMDAVHRVVVDEE